MCPTCKELRELLTRYRDQLVRVSAQRDETMDLLQAALKDLRTLADKLATLETLSSN